MLAVIARAKTREGNKRDTNRERMSKTNPMSSFIRDHKDSIRNPLELNNNVIKVA